MCITIVFRKLSKEFPLIIGNNRDELIKRKFSPPQILCSNPKIIGPKDLERGGTWLGINKNRILVNILNKWTGNKNFFGSDKYISRGQLVVELLKLNSIEDMLKKIKSININNYLPFHLLIADENEAYVILHNNNLEIHNISDKNIFILGNINPFRQWEKYEYGYNFIKKKKINNYADIVSILKELLSYHNGNKDIPSIDYAVDLGNFRTTSSSIVMINKKLIYKFHNGFPHKNSLYKDYIFE